MAQWYVVVKKFGGPDGRVFQPGELLDVSEAQRNVQRLVAHRYLRPATVDEVANAVEVEAEEVVPARVARRRR
jgi:allophanate hydrolase subunit 2